MAGAPYKIDCTWTDDETQTFAFAMSNLDGSPLDTSGITAFEYAVRDSCGAEQFRLSLSNGISIDPVTARVAFVLPALPVGRYRHGGRFTSSSITEQLFDGSIVVSEGEF